MSAADRDQIVIQASTALKEALAEYAQQRNVSMAQVIRESISRRIDYDLAGEPKTMRTTRYPNPAARKAAALERAKRTRARDKAILAALKRGDRDEADRLAGVEPPDDDDDEFDDEPDHDEN